MLLLVLQGFGFLGLSLLFSLFQIVGVCFIEAAWFVELVFYGFGVNFSLLIIFETSIKFN